jgi:hypothetical protein
VKTRDINISDPGSGVHAVGNRMRERLRGLSTVYRVPKKHGYATIRITRKSTNKSVLRILPKVSAQDAASTNRPRDIESAINAVSMPQTLIAENA